MVFILGFGMSLGMVLWFYCKLKRTLPKHQHAMIFILGFDISFMNFINLEKFRKPNLLEFYDKYSHLNFSLDNLGDNPQLRRRLRLLLIWLLFFQERF